MEGSRKLIYLLIFSFILSRTRRWGDGSGTGWVAAAEVGGSQGDAWHKVRAAGGTTAPIAWPKADVPSLTQDGSSTALQPEGIVFLGYLCIYIVTNETINRKHLRSAELCSGLFLPKKKMSPEFFILNNFYRESELFKASWKLLNRWNSGLDVDMSSKKQVNTLEPPLLQEKKKKMALGNILCLASARGSKQQIYNTIAGGLSGDWARESTREWHKWTEAMTNCPLYSCFVMKVYI